MFRKVLVANRGEIAVRVMRTCRVLGIATVAVYADADREALHVRSADEAVRIGPSAPAESYLSIDRVIEAARRTGAEAVHPGYGFLSEDADFAEACASAGLRFIGPPPAAMRLLGDKPAARRLATSLGIPVLPGAEEDGAGDASLLGRAREIGFPVMIKAAAGGGGRGMRLVTSAEDFPLALESARREATASFGDGRLLLERAVVGGRHVEVQLLLDGHGGAVHLGERDCSTQRRFQKVIEESPSPAVTPALRGELGDAALRLARAAGYENAGTVEFLVSRDGAWYFLECNTRLQVEHPVTEAVTGLDLVALQLAVAAGEPLGIAQADVRVTGHAIECRLYAEDPARTYAPSPGRLRHFALPSGNGVRLDAGYAAGAMVPGEYDALLAKVIAYGASRGDAVQRARRALDAWLVDGVHTNLGLLAAVLDHPDFEAGTADLTTLESMPPEAFAPRLTDEVLVAAAVSQLVERPGVSDPWTALGAWRLHGVAEQRWAFQGAPFETRTERVPGRTDAWRVTIGEREYDVAGEAANPETVVVTTARVRRAWTTLREDEVLRLRAADGHEYALLLQPPGPIADGARAVAVARASNVLQAPIPGVMVRVLVTAGDRVRAGQPLVVLEAMKMEHTLQAPEDATVVEVHCALGVRVSEGDALLTLEFRTDAVVSA